MNGVVSPEKRGSMYTIHFQSQIKDLNYNLSCTGLYTFRFIIILSDKITGLDIWRPDISYYVLLLRTLFTRTCTPAVLPTVVVFQRKYVFDNCQICPIYPRFSLPQMNAGPVCSCTMITWCMRTPSYYISLHGGGENWSLTVTSRRLHARKLITFQAPVSS